MDLQINRLTNTDMCKGRYYFQNFYAKKITHGSKNVNITKDI